MLKLLQSHAGRVIISILWGLALSLFFKKTCVGNSCIVVKAPPAAEISQQIYRFHENGHCYKFKPVLKSCLPIERK